MRNVTFVLAVTAVLALAGTAWGTVWQGDDATNPTDWGTAENWSAGLPDSGTNASIYVSNLCEITSTTDADCNFLYIGSSGAGELQMSGGTLDTGNTLFVGYNTAVGKTAKFTQTGGTVSAREFDMAWDWSGSDAIYSISSNATFTSRGYFRVSRTATATFEVKGGDATITLTSTYEQRSGGTLKAVVESSGFSTIAVAGKATFAGKLVVDDMTGGTASGTYTIMTYGSRVGTYADADVTLPGPGWSWDATGDDTTAGALTVTVPEPATLSLLGVGLVGVLLRRKRR